MTAPDLLRVLLVIAAAGLTLLAMLSLFRRHVSQPALTLWMLLAFFPPFLGPLLVIALGPALRRQQE
jgi:asparagine N-glycosylation enzyme membrane subunit Stt3